MFYYQFNIGDYASHTSRLSLMEDLAYRRMLDLYYLNEQPLSGCSTDVAREIGMMDQMDSVEYVLNKFFVFSDEKWHQNRVDFEINQYQKKKEQQSRAGKASAKARKIKASERTLNGRSTENQQPSNQTNNPITQETNKPINNNKDPLCQNAFDCLDYFNQVTGSKLKKDTKSHIENITARLRDGYSVDDIKLVISYKYQEWKGDPKMMQYIRPSTLFQTGKFNGYLMAAKTNATKPSFNLSEQNYVSGDL